ncbi:MAG: hypothetical protein R3B70_01820 [Polyangiaceae bacterium]
MKTPSFDFLPRRSLGAFAAAAAVTLLSAAGVRADDAVCPLHRELPVERQIRRLSIDLRGTLPDMADYEAADGATKVPDAVLDAYLDSDELRVQMRRYHESLLWTNPNIIIGDTGFALSNVNFGGGTVVYYMTGRRGTYRGGDGTHTCQNKPQADLGYDPDGRPTAEYKGKDNGIDWWAEGWVEVHPYWEPDPNKTLKVCAFDAQTSAEYTIPTGANAGTYSCNHVLSHAQLSADKKNPCGCGPELKTCILTGTVQPVVLASMREQMLRLIDLHTVGGRPYSEILTSKSAHYNGPLVHYFKYLGREQTFNRTVNVPQPADGKLPDLGYLDQDTWVEIERESPHAGVLTLPAYLLRFQTNRGRANRYRIAFTGQYFQPPSTKDSNCAEQGNDLTGRCVCRGCHTTLEPLAAHFGQFLEAGSTVLRDFEREYDTQNACAKGIGPSSTAWCDRHYLAVPSMEDPDIRPYRLKALEYADPNHPLVQPHFDAGPEGLAKQDIESGVFHRVAVEHLFEFLMKRPPDLDVTSPDYEGDVIEQIAADFQQHDDFKKAIRALVSLPAYRRMP